MKIVKFLSIVIISLILLTGCKKKNIINETESSIPVEVTLIKKSSIDRNIELVGTLSAWKEANLGAQTSGRIQKIYVEEGNRVKEGDLLFEMDDTQLAQAKIQYQIAKDNYERMKPLYESGSISQSQFEQIKATYETTEKNYNLLLTNTQFRAPFSGIITAKKLNEGEVFLLAPTGGVPTIVSLMQINPLKLILNVSESNLRDIKIGQLVEIQSDVYPEEIFKGIINRINPTINPSTRTFQIELKINNPQEKLRPGMYVKANIYLGKTEGILVERSSILKQLGTAAYYAFIVKNNTAKRIDVKLGQEFNNYVEVIDGLSEGNYIVSKGQGILKDGNKVEIKNKVE